MNLRIIHLTLLLTLTMMISSTGCSAIKPEPTATVKPYPTIRPPQPTRTPTFTPTATSLPTGTSTISPTPTLPPPLDDFSQARLYAFGPLPGWDFSFTLTLPGKIIGDYRGTVGDPPKAFICRPLTEYSHPERLYCTGRIPKVDQDLEFKVFEKTTGQEVFKGTVFSPLP